MPALVVCWPAPDRALCLFEDLDGVALGWTRAAVEKSLPLAGPRHHPPHRAALVAVVAVVDPGEVPVK